MIKTQGGRGGGGKPEELEKIVILNICFESSPIYNWDRMLYIFGKDYFYSLSNLALPNIPEGKRGMWVNCGLSSVLLSTC